MKTLKLTITSAMALALFFTSCKKEETTPTVPNKNPTNQTGPTPVTPTPSGGNISGALISIRMKYTTQPTGSPMPIDVNSEMGLAVFYSAAGSTTKADAGKVSVNTVNLDKQSDNSYLKTAYIGGTPADLGFDKTSDWNIAGSGSVTAFSYDHNVKFPEYTGDVPSSITKANGISLSFTGATLTGADSVYVVIAAGSNNIVKSYAANAGNITISAADLQNLPAVTDNSAVFEICPFKYNEVVKNGKTYFFIKEQAIVKAVNIN